MTEAHPEEHTVDLTETDDVDQVDVVAGELDEPSAAHEVQHHEHDEQDQDHAQHGEHEYVEHAERAATQLSVLPTPVPGPTGVPGVDAALDRLAELTDLDSDPEQHVAVLEDVHDRLQSALSGPDESAR